MAERFDVSPEAVMGRRSAASRTVAPDAVEERGRDTSREPGDPEPSTMARLAVSERVTRTLVVARAAISSWRVAAVFGVVAVLAVIGAGLAWASASRSYAAQEAWEERAEVWQERAGEHADERDEAIARVGQTRGRNRTLTEEIAELEREIERLAADNAGLTDENQVLADALASLGYRLAP